MIENSLWCIMFQAHERGARSPYLLVEKEERALEICQKNNGNLSATIGFIPWTYIILPLKKESEYELK